MQTAVNTPHPGASMRPFREPPKDRPWDFCEMLVATPDGHRIMLGQPPKPG